MEHDTLLRRAEQTVRESEITARQVQLFRIIKGRRPCWVSERAT
jgi:hypothetical protein